MKHTLNIDAAMILADNDQWENRFYVESATSDNLYTISQHKTGRYWGCNCPGWKRHKHCKHLEAVGLPAHMLPKEVKINKQ